MYLGMIETMSLKILLKGFHENFSDLFIKTTRYLVQVYPEWLPFFTIITHFEGIAHAAPAQAKILKGRDLPNEVEYI